MFIAKKNNVMGDNVSGNIEKESRKHLSQLLCVIFQYLQLNNFFIVILFDRSLNNSQETKKNLNR